MFFSAGNRLGESCEATEFFEQFVGTNCCPEQDTLLPCVSTPTMVWAMKSHFHTGVGSYVLAPPEKRFLVKLVKCRAANRTLTQSNGHSIGRFVWPLSIPPRIFAKS